MISAILIIHVIVCFFLILIVLLQTGKGADIGAAFGGTSTQTLFGSTGGNTFFNKLTIGVATVFMMTCLLLAYFSSKPGTTSIMKKNRAAQTAPVQQTEQKQVPAKSEKAAADAQNQDVNKNEQAKQASSPAVAPGSATKTSSSVGTPQGASSSAGGKKAEAPKK